MDSTHMTTDLILSEHLATLGYKPRAEALISPLAKTYEIRNPGITNGRVEILGTLPYKARNGAIGDITWHGIYTEADGLKVLSVDAMVAPAVLMARLDAEGLRPRVTFRAGAKDADDPQQVLEDLMPLVSSLEQLLCLR